MLKTIDDLLFEYREYKNPYIKISREEKNKKLIKLKRGLYVDDINTDPFIIAQYLYSPSYISFETALSYHGMIPEKVVAITSATFNKNKTKHYDNHFGHFVYKDIPASAFPYGVENIIDGNYCIQIASKEKSLTDMLYKVPKVRSLKDLKALLFEDLRINELVFDELGYKELLLLCDLYNSSNLKLLKNYITQLMERGHNDK